MDKDPAAIPFISLDEVYEIGLNDARRMRPRRETFLLRKWGREQEAYYIKGYSDGVSEARYPQRVHVLSSAVNGSLARMSDSRKIILQ